MMFEIVLIIFVILLLMFFSIQQQQKQNLRIRYDPNLYPSEIVSPMYI